MIGKKFYYSLAEVSKFPIVISYLKHTAKYVGFSNYTTLYHWYINTPDKYYHEVIRDNYSHKFFIDLDNCNSDITIILLELKNIFGKDFSYTVFESHGINKFSHHIIVHLLIPTLNHSKYIAKILIDNLPVHISSCIDTSIYNHNRSLRIEGSIKDYRVKYNIMYPKHISPAKEFFDGLVSYNTGYEEMVFNIPDIFYNNCRNTISVDMIDLNNFKVRKQDYKYVYLDRIAPSYCHICERVHDKENAAIDQNNNFICWRNI